MPKPVPHLQAEKFMRDQGHRMIAGLDEVGAGPLAGPVVAAAVILPKNPELDGISDSKCLTEKQRWEIREKILQQALAISIAPATEREIDDINIFQARYLAMKRAVDNLSVKPDALLIDGPHKIDSTLPQLAITSGDQTSVTIAAASVVAKVFRDTMMEKLAKQFPGYGLEKHKGYGTPQHRTAVQELGPSPIHRLTFLSRILNEDLVEQLKQAR